MRWSLAFLVAALVPSASAALLRAHAASEPPAPDFAARTVRGGWPEDCVPEELELERQEDLDGGKALRPVQRAGEASNMSQGDVYLGWLQRCQKGKAMGIRMEVEQWPSSVRLDFFPLPHWDAHNKVFEKPTVAASGGWRTSGAADKDSVEDGILFEPGRSGRNFEFGLSARPGGDEVRGRLLWPGHDDPDWLPGPSELEDYPFFCREFQAEKCTDAPPRPGEKVVVFMRHGSAACNVDGTDPILNQFGEDQVKERMFDPNLVRVMSNRSRERAEVILISPMARTMHTALLTFGERLKSIKWELEANLVELGGVGSARSAAGERLLRNFSATALLDQYRALIDMAAEEVAAPKHHEHGQHHSTPEGLKLQREGRLDRSWLENARRAVEAEPLSGGHDADGPELQQRFARFTQGLLKRPETRFIAISHKHILKAGISVALGQTQTVIMALSPEGSWRRVAQPPHCWPGFRA